MDIRNFWLLKYGAQDGNLKVSDAVVNDEECEILVVQKGDSVLPIAKIITGEDEVKIKQ